MWWQKTKRQRGPRCRCVNRDEKPCRRAAVRGSLFCKAHQLCDQSPMSGSEPSFNPDRYNNDPRVQETHNCWAYGMNVLDPEQLTQCLGQGVGCKMLYHQPGGTKGLSDRLMTEEGRSCPVVEDLMKADVTDITNTTFRGRCPTDKSKIALVVDAGEDYHFYRQDADGMWSHKDGANKVKRYDAEGKPIWNPKTAARDYRPNGSFLNYENFCGYYCVPRRKTIKLSRGQKRKLPA